MSDNEVPDFDPRFDPAFQRGFDGPTTRRSQITGGEAPSGYLRNPRPVSVQPPAALLQPVDPARNEGWENFLGSPADVAAASVAAPVSQDAADAEPELTTRGRNPFLIVLLAISVLLIAGGVGGLQWLRAKFLAPDIATDLDFVTLQAATVGAAIVVGLGLATAIGVLFVYAVRWRGRSY